ncbi:MAG: hypothetical protein JO157_06675 [Acetobacteraceae bacterium]|nr:hypothetical protein [Acetobacteraceae bacterium]
MGRGDFAGAWQISDRILQSSGEPDWTRPRHLQRVWSGAPLAGRRVLVRCYHGLGDTIQFIRLARPLRELAAEVTVWVQPALLALIAGVAGVDRVLPLHDGTPDVAYDVDIEIMELAHALRIDLSTLPRAVPYIFPPRRRSAAQRRRACIGLVWQAGGWDARRTLPDALVERLIRSVDADFVSLRPGAMRLAVSGMIDASSESIVSTAVRMAELDLVISVDTMAAHLAGALGRPVWTLLHASCDWRWMRDREDSPWYPTMRLFRQPRPDDWSAVVNVVIQTLRAHLVDCQSPRRLPPVPAFPPRR